jgi:NAD(P)-dependent dehydrogenase (short-subunit alcohol dehydrogenase family)
MGDPAEATILVTGATDGLGKLVALELAARGATVLLHGRNRDRLEAALEEMRRETGGEKLHSHLADLSSLGAVRKLAERILSNEERLDVLVNNAGVLCPQRRISADGVELTFGTNVIGYYLMTRELLDMLRGSAPARVVNVTSTFASDLDLDDLQFERRPYDGMRAYAQSKACDRMLTWAFARRLAETGVTVNAMAPGLVTETNLYDDLPADVRHGLEQQPSRSVAEGTDTAVWLAAAADVEGVSGKFYEQRAEQPCQFRDLEAEEKLWAVCQAIAD